MLSSIDLSCQIAEVELKTCLYNASGALCTFPEELLALNGGTAETGWQCQSGAILSKSCTLEYREGNPGKRYHYQPEGQISVNSTGLANMGHRFYGRLAGNFRSMGINKPYFQSVAGLSADNNLEILRFIRDLEVQPQAIELNLSCPNIIGKPQMGYDFEGSRELLQRVFALNTEPDRPEKAQLPPIGLKLPPYFDPVHFKQMADVIQEFPIAFITCCNSLGHCLIVDSDLEQTVICPNKGHGGLGGSLMKPVALANVRRFRNLLPDHVAVIGCGGVATGRDVFEHILCGATAVQLGTCLVEEGVGCFARILDELKDIMANKGYRKLSDFRGNLKDLPVT